MEHHPSLRGTARLLGVLSVLCTCAGMKRMMEVLGVFNPALKGVSVCGKKSSLLYLKQCLSEPFDIATGHT
jgi:hypothetical protein